MLLSLKGKKKGKDKFDFAYFLSPDVRLSHFSIVNMNKWNDNKNNIFFRKKKW